MQHSTRRNAEAVRDALYYLVAHRCSSPDSIRASAMEQLRLFGFSKDHKDNEVQVVMGLLIDNNGIPNMGYPFRSTEVPKEKKIQNE